MRVLLGIAVVLVACACACAHGGPNYIEPLTTIKGRLTDEGLECPTLRDGYGQLYSLVGDTGGFRRGDRVCVRGRRVDRSLCDLGIAIKIEWIGPWRSCP